MVSVQLEEELPSNVLKVGALYCSSGLSERIEADLYLLSQIDEVVDVVDVVAEAAEQAQGQRYQ